MNSATKDELNVASKMMAIGQSLQQVIAEMTSHPAREIKHEELGNLSVGSVADIAVLRLENGHFGFTDMDNVRVDGTKKLIAEITLKDGKIVYDLNGMEADKYGAPPSPHADQAYRWTSFAHGPRPTVPSDNNRH
jgi:dihydroorotase